MLFVQQSLVQCFGCFAPRVRIPSDNDDPTFSGPAVWVTSAAIQIGTQADRLTTQFFFLVVDWGIDVFNNRSLRDTTSRGCLSAYSNVSFDAAGAQSGTFNKLQAPYRGRLDTVRISVRRTPDSSTGVTASQPLSRSTVK